MSLDTTDATEPLLDLSDLPLPIVRTRVPKVTNAQFRRMTPARQRVTIARDVLRWLDQKKLIPETGVYLRVYDDATRQTGFHEGDIVDGYQCVACGLGATFACALDRGVLSPVPPADRLSWPNCARRALAPYFDVVQLLAIECAFECNAVFMRALTPDSSALQPEYSSLGQRSAQFGRRIQESVPYDLFFDPWLEGACRRMRAIMQNIIDNDGTFVP